MKLLVRTIRNYALVSALLFIISTPLFYWAIYSLVIKQMDEMLQEHKRDFVNAAPFIHTEYELRQHEQLNKEFNLTLVPHGNIINDSLYTEKVFDSIALEFHPYRTFRTAVRLHGAVYELKISESMVSSKDLVMAIVLIQCILLTLLFTTLVIINRQLSSTVWSPFYRIVDQLKNYRIDKDNFINLPKSSTHEFRDLSQAIDQLIEKNKNTYLSQKEFTENASHEIQTPLAVLNSKIDLLMQTELTEYQAELISSIQNSSQRISKLNRSLLLLAKIDNQQFGERENIDFTNVVDGLINQLKEVMEQHNLSVHFLQHDRVILHANKVLIEILVSNLLTNALRYAPHHSKINVSITQEQFYIENDGQAFKNASSLFNRFSKEDQSTFGTGLGLALVKQICQELSYAITYTYLDSKHRFTILFSKG
ncbi:sensor histidine kinase [Chryseotalea sanaruensis]|uniref:histidine kinase n=1 Tax=Chryseotalea sanaruensis TaxID=2482724 RepID=A0A401U5W0_9BACT|nr:HAMP domain-containing sensor histidine kinase [Chryseotalea sanaruensis]GCC50277.1 sensor histidine kinase [Chryseotalea sanaruensis]